MAFFVTKILIVAGFVLVGYNVLKYLLGDNEKDDTQEQCGSWDSF